MQRCRGKYGRIMLLPILPGVALMVLLSACGSPGATTTTAGAATQTTTSPAGNTATTQPASANATLAAQIEPLQAIRMVDTSNGWALTTKNVVLKTSDGGHHWQNV